MRKTLTLILLLFTGLKADVIPDTWYDFLEFKPVKYGIMDNRHLPGHVFWMGTFTYATKRYTAPLLKERFGINLTNEQILDYGLKGMILFEGYQVIEKKFDVAGTYGSVERWFWDSGGDVLAPYLVMRWILYSDEPPRWWNKLIGRDIACDYNPFTKQIMLEVTL